MRDVAWRLSFTLTSLVILVILGPSAGCAFGNRFVEQIRGQTPEAQIARYFQAVTQKDRPAALARLPLLEQSDAALVARCGAVTDELLALGPGLDYRIVEAEWWRACCEPGVIDDPRNAGAARVWVAVSRQGSAEAVYVFDVLVPGGYWGEAVGNPVRHWAIVDIYHQGEEPLVWIWKE